MPDAQAAKQSCLCKQEFAHPEVADEKYVVYFDERRRFLRVSRGVSELLRVPVEELIGITLDNFIPAEVAVNADLFSEFLKEGYQDSVIAMVNRDGRLLGVRAHMRRLKDGCLVMCWEKL